MTRIYLDHAATTPVYPEVLEAMMPYFTEEYGNASSLHSAGRTGREAVEEARARVAALIGAKPEEIYFTSGGTESDNQALRSAWERTAPVKEVVDPATRTARKCIFITTAFEHKAILNTCAQLEKLGAEVHILQPSKDGYVTAAQVEEVLRTIFLNGAERPEAGQTAGTDPFDSLHSNILVSVMAANNELGTIQAIAGIGAVCRRYNVLFHTDAVQAVGHIPMDVNALNVDMLSASAHKFGGPKGVGFLYVRAGIPVEPLLFGGGQEHGLRSGTLNTPGIVGLGKAAEIAERELEMCENAAENAGKELKSELLRITSMRDRFEARILAGLQGVHVNGSSGESKIAAAERGEKALFGIETQLPRLPGHSNLRIRGVESESLLILLDMKGICASGGSACAAGTEEVSHVLTAIGLTDDEASECVRFTFGPGVSDEDADRAAETVIDSVKKLRELRGCIVD